MEAFPARLDSKASLFLSQLDPFLPLIFSGLTGEGRAYSGDTECIHEMLDQYP